MATNSRFELTYSKSGLPWFTFGRRESPGEIVQKWEEQKCRSVYLKQTPKFRFLVPISSAKDLSAVERVANEFACQSYENWEVNFLVTSKVKELKEILIRKNDLRFTVTVTADFSGDSDQNFDRRWLDNADYVGWLDSATTLSPVALFLLAESLELVAPAVIYWNAVSCDPSGGSIRERVRRPSFSPYTLENGNYLGWDWLASVKELSPSQGTNFAKRHSFLRERAASQLPWVLQPAVLSYHRHPLMEKMEQVKSAADAASSEPNVGPLTVLVCFKDRAEWTARAVRDFAQVTGKLDVTFLLIDNQSSMAERHKLDQALAEISARVQIVEFSKPFNFAAMTNWAIDKHVKTENIFLLNNDVFWGDGDTAEILSLLEKGDVATIGIPLKYPNGGYQHLGFRAFLDAPPHQIRIAPIQTPHAFSFWGRETFANTFAACFLKRSLFLEIGGLSELEMANGFGDVAFCLECGQRKLRNIIYAKAWAYHLESGSRGKTYEFWEEAALQRRYPGRLSLMEYEELSLETVGPLDWVTPFLGTVKESLREQGGAWEKMRGTVSGLSRFSRRPRGVKA